MNLLAYIQGKRKGKEAHHIEREAMHDPFLADALDGFDAVGGNHADRIAKIRMRLSASRKKSNRNITYISVAVSLLLCISIGGYFLMNRNEQQPIIAQSKPLTEEKDAIGNMIAEEEIAMDQQIAGEIMEEPHDQMQENTEAIIGNSPVPPSQLSSPAIQEELMVMADDVMDQKEAEILLPEIADAEIQPDNEDSLIIAQSETRQASKFVTPSGTRQRAMTSSATAGKPEPKIGMKAYRKYLKDSMNRPNTGDCVNKKGDVIVEFKIDSEGRPHNIGFRKKLCEDLDKEAVRLIENGPVWVGDTNKSVILEVKF